MNYPPEVQEKIDVLANYYSENEDLESFDILHLYPGEIAFPDGYIEARFFNLVGYNTAKKQKRSLGRHDALFTAEVIIRDVEIYADGSTCLVFAKPIYMLMGQAPTLLPEKLK